MSQAKGMKQALNRNVKNGIYISHMIRSTIVDPEKFNHYEEPWRYMVNNQCSHIREFTSMYTNIQGISDN